MSKKGSVFENHPRISLILFTFIIIILIDYIAGLVLIPNNYNAFRVSNYYYHHGLAPNFNGTAAWGPIYYPMTTNSLGFRDFKNTKVKLKKINKKRILFLGDSHTEAVGIHYENSFAGILTKKLEKENIEVLNASAVSYSPKIHYLKGDYLLNKIGLEVDEIIVFIDISDLQNELVYEKYKPHTAIFVNNIKQNSSRFLKKHSFIYYTISTMIGNKRTSDFFKQARLFDKERNISTTKNTEEIYASFFSDFHDKEMLQNPDFHGVSKWYYDKYFIKLADKGIRLGEENIKKLDSICKEKNIKLSISVHPWRTQIGKMNPKDYYVKAWKKFANENNIGFINLFPVFINNINPGIVQEEYYLKMDNHWNKKGHKAVADELYKYIKQGK